jgi:hypothetical protein
LKVVFHIDIDAFEFLSDDRRAIAAATRQTNGRPVTTLSCRRFAALDEKSLNFYDYLRMACDGVDAI